MIYKDGKQVSGIYFSGKVITAVYFGAKLVWETVKSCFGNGYWINGKPWRNNDAWRNK